MGSRAGKDDREIPRYTPERKRELAAEGKMRRATQQADRPKVKIGDSPAASGIEKLTHPTNNIERQLADLGA